MIELSYYLEAKRDSYLKDYAIRFENEHTDYERFNESFDRVARETFELQKLILIGEKIKIDYVLGEEEYLITDVKESSKAVNGIKCYEVEYFKNNKVQTRTLEKRQLVKLIEAVKDIEDKTDLVKEQYDIRLRALASFNQEEC